MTKSQERGENDISRAAKLWSARTGSDVSVILKTWLTAAKRRRDSEGVQKILKAQKYLGCRNRRKRKKP